MTTDRTLTAFFLDFARKHKGRFFLSFLMMPVYAALMAAAPKLLQVAIDDGIAAGDVGKTVRTGWLYLVCVFGSFAALVIQNLAMQIAGIRTLADMRDRLMRRISFLGKDRYDERPIGVYVSRTTSDVEAIGETMAAGLTNIISDALLIVFIFVNMILLNARLGLFTLILLPVVVIIVDVFRRILRRLYDEIRTINGVMTARINESLAMLFEVRNFHLGAKFTDDFRECNHAYRDRSISAISYDALVFSLLEGLSFISIGLILLLTAMASDGGSSTLKVGGVVAYIQWLWLLFQPIKQMGSRFAVLQSALAAVNKVHQIMTLPLPADDGDQEPESLDLKVDDVTFAYNGDELVLQHVTLDVPRGSSRALVGPTGAGKSTLIRLLTRQYDIAEGRGDITIGGLSIKAVPRERLKHLIVLVPQEPAIFRESVFYNIGLNRPEITREQVTAVCEKIQADRFIRNLSDGYDTLLASDGSNLSMGQRQLVALARALVSDAEILIFDEATANIDTETELMIQNALDYAMQQKTVILIAHRLSTIRDVDEIAVMHHGRIIDQGSHDVLLSRPGLYRKMYELQREGSGDQ